MGFNYSDNKGSQTFNNNRIRFEEADIGKNLQIRRTEESMRAVMNELENVRLDPPTLDSKLKKTGLSGYRRSSVEAYVEELKRSTNQLKDNMEQQIQNLSAECMRLKSESRVLRGQIVQAEEQTNQVKEMLAAVTNERDAAEHRISETDAELKTMEDRVSFYESENAKTEELKCSLQKKTDELDCAAAENDRLKGQIKDFSKRINRINDEFSKYKDRKSADSAEIDRLKQQVSSLQENNDVLKSELNGARQELSKIAGHGSDEMRTQFPEERAELMKKYSSLYAEYKKEQARGNSLVHEKEAISKLLEEYQKKEQGNAMLRKKDKEQRDAIEELQNVINGLLNEVQHQQEMYDHLSTERSENKELIYNLTRDRSNLHVQNVDLQVQNVELLDKNEELSKRVSRLEEENARLNLLLKQKQASAVLPLLQAEQTDSSDDASEERFSDTMKKVRNVGSSGGSGFRREIC